MSDQPQETAAPDNVVQLKQRELFNKAIAFAEKNLAESGLSPDDFQLVPNNDTPAIAPFIEKLDNGRTVYGYKMQYPERLHDNYMDFAVKRYYDHPDHKYEGPSGRQELFWASGYDKWLGSKIKFLVEGEKKALAFAKYLEATTVGLRGCWGFCANSRMLVDLVKTIRQGDKVFVCMDGDFTTHPDIKMAAGTLARQIVALGAEPIYVIFPHQSDGSRMGADDWIMSFPETNRTVDFLRDQFDALPIYDWRELPESPKFIARRLRLQVDSKGNALKNEENTSAIMEDLFGREALFTDQYKGAMFMPKDGSYSEPRSYTDETFDSVLYRYFERIFGTWSKDAFRAVRRAFIGTNKRNLLGEKLRKVKWDGVSRVEMAMHTYWGAEDTDYTRKVSKGFFMGAVARCLYPGIKWDHVLILEGKQRKGKSYSLELITYGYYVNVKMGESTDSISRKSCSAWCVNCDELDHMTKGNREAFKSWVSETHENWVPKYIEYARETPRPFFITGTTNEEVYLNDPTGAQRFWPIKVAQTREQVDLVGLQRDRDQLWAEAMVLLEAAGDDWWREFENDRTGATEHQAEREQDDPLSEIINAALHTHTLPEAVVQRGGQQLAMGKVVTYIWLTNIAMNSNLPQALKTTRAIGDAAKRLGLERVQILKRQLDEESLHRACRAGSNVTVMHDQFPSGHVPERIRVYILPEEHF